MFALLRQLSKLLLLVFNLPQVLSLLSNLFKVTPRADGTLELGIVDTIATATTATETLRLKEQIEQGKQQDLREVQEETEQLKSLYADLDPEQREFFTSRAEARKERKINEINNRSADDIINENVIDQIKEDKKKQIEPTLVSALAPLTTLLGIPILLTKLSEYVSAASGFTSGITSKDTADSRADAYTSEFDDGGGDSFNGVVTERGDLEITFNGIDNNEDFKIFTTQQEGDEITLEVTGPGVPTGQYVAAVEDYGDLDETEQRNRNFFQVTTSGTTIKIVCPPSPDAPAFLFDALEREYGWNKETEIVLRINELGGVGFADVRIPVEISLDNSRN